MTWFYLAFLSAVLFAIGTLLARVLVIKSESTRAFSFLYNITGAFLSLFIFLIEPWNFSFPSMQIILLTILATFLYGIFERTNFYVRKYIEASLFGILFRLSPVITFISAILFLGENLSLVKVLAAILIVSGNILVVYRNQKLKIDKNFLFAFIPITAFGLVRIFDKEVSPHYPLQLYNFIVWFFPAIYVYLPFVKPESLKKELKLASWRIPLLALINLSGFYILLKALGLAEASRVTLISSTSTIFVVLAGILILGERTHFLRKIIAAILVFIGAFLIR